MDEKITEFRGITGCNEEEGRQFVEATDGNLELAMDLYFQQQPVSSSTTSQQPLNGNNYPGPSATNDDGVQDSPMVTDDQVRSPIEKTSGVLVGESYRSTYAPTVRVTSNSIFDHSRDFRAEAELQSQRMTRRMTGRGRGSEANVSGTSSSADADKKRTLAQLFKPPVDIICLETWDKVRKISAREGRWLLVNVQNVVEFKCQVLNRDLWNNETVKNLITNNFTFWQVYNDSADGQRFQSYYNVNRYPFVAIIDPRTGELVSDLKVVDAVQFCELATEFLSSHPTFQSLDDRLSTKQPAVASAESEDAEASANGHVAESRDKVSLGKRKRVARNFLDSASSLDSPPVKAGKTNDSSGEFSKSEVNMNGDDVFSEKIAEEICAKLRCEDWRQYIGKDGDPVLNLMFRFPDGSREKLSIPATSSLKAIALFLESKGCPSEDYELVLNFPKRVVPLSREAQSQLLESTGIRSQEVIHVERK